MTFGLAMIVRDEAAVIERCLASLLPILDYWSITDTGSEDDTLAVIQRVLEGIPGELHRSTFENFRQARTEAMSNAYGTADYLFLLDADMVLHLPDPMPPLSLDCYQGRIRGTSLDYTLPLLVSGHRHWKYEGVAHSYLACDGPYTEDELPGLAVHDFSSTGPEKLRRDLALLSAELARNPLDARTAFYLAQTYSDLDMIPEAIAAYRYRAHLEGWAEETFVAKHRLGTLLCENISFDEGAEALLDAWRFRPQRIESLRCLAASANAVADKAPYPDDRLFVWKPHYNLPESVLLDTRPFPPLPSIAPIRPRRGPRVSTRNGLARADVSAIIVTRGNVDLEPILHTIPYPDVVVWNNTEREHDYKPFGRYAAIPETKNPVIFWVDDDVKFTNHDALLRAYEPGKLIANMDADWIKGAGYEGIVAMQGAGSLCDASLPAEVFARYFAEYPWDEDARIEADFIFGVLAPAKVIDIGYDTMPYTDDPDRLYTQPGQTERKWRMIERCRAMLSAA